MMRVKPTSALVPKADIAERCRHVRFVPKADSCSAANSRAGDDPARLTPSEKTDSGDGSSEREACLCSARRQAVRRRAGDDCNSIATVRHSISELSSNGLLR
jgi:hypothetical protein